MLFKRGKEITKLSKAQYKIILTCQKQNQPAINFLNIAEKNLSSLSSKFN